MKIYMGVYFKRGSTTLLNKHQTSNIFFGHYDL